MKRPQKPNLFIVGAPKSGTTALHKYLSSHPDICMASYKEPHYFASDLKDFHRAEDISEYLGFFKHCPATSKVIGEGSVWYLSSKTAIKNIYNFDPNAKIVAMLRDPVSLFLSFHTQALFSHWEDEPDPEKAWNLQYSRTSPEKLPLKNRTVETLQYGNVAKLGDQVEHLLSIFPQDQVHLIFFEDFTKNTRHEYLKLLNFLGLDDDGLDHFPKVNSSRQHRWEWLGRATTQAPTSAVKLVQTIRKITGLDPMRLVRRIRDLNAIKKQTPMISDDFRRHLLKHFRRDTDKLERITCRNLSHWKR